VLEGVDDALRRTKIAGRPLGFWLSRIYAIVATAVATTRRT
jgi:hypothetical protein